MQHSKRRFILNLQVTSASQEGSPHFHGSQILNRHEAESRLKQLTPGTEEHRKLQDALVRTASIREVCLPTVTYKVNSAAENCALPGGFGSSEHYEIGAEVNLKGLPAKKNTPLLVTGVTPISFQHIVALAGDFYGVAGQLFPYLGGLLQIKPSDL